ncbi:MAG: hypothetical protein ACI9G1_000124 [Pirellulaceae bacterium]|jgi:hypothetical protein
MMHRAKGACGSFIFRRCFVAGTPVVIAIERDPADESALQEDESFMSDWVQTGLGIVPIVVGVGGAIALLKGTKRKEELEKRLVRDAVFAGGDGNWSPKQKQAK